MKGIQVSLLRVRLSCAAVDSDSTDLHPPRLKPPAAQVMAGLSGSSHYPHHLSIFSCISCFQLLMEMEKQLQEWSQQLYFLLAAVGVRLFIPFSLHWCTIALLRKSICSSFKASVKLLCYRIDGARRRSNLIYPSLERPPINSLSIEPIDYRPSSLQKNYVDQRSEIHMIGNSSSLLSVNLAFWMSPYKAVDWKPQRRPKELCALRIRLHLHMDQAQENYRCMLDTSNKATRLPGLQIQWPLHLWWAGWVSTLLLPLPLNIVPLSLMEQGLDMLWIFIIFSKTKFFLKKALPVLIRPSEIKLYLLKHCNIVQDAVIAALLLSRLVVPQGHGYCHVPDHPGVDRTAWCSSLL